MHGFRKSVARRLLPALIVFGLLTGCNDESDSAGTAASSPGSSSSPVQSVANPTIEEPSPKGMGMISVSSTMFPLALVGYSADEYFVSGTAVNYTLDGEPPADGYWNLRQDSGRAAYKTRIVVYKPKNPARFNGTVIVEWLNVSGGLDAAPGWINAHTELLRQGYGWVGVSAQKEGIDGGGPISMMKLPLKTFDRVRYGSLVHPGNRYSYDMFSQVAQAIRNPQGVNLFDGLTVKKLIASGESQSAMRMVSYVNGVAPLTRLFDGFMIHSRTFGSAPVSNDVMGLPSDTSTVMRVRTDIAPVMTLQTESDLFLLNYYPSRQDDGTNFRLWEVAGATHVDTYTLTGLFDVNGSDLKTAEVMETRQPVPGILTCAKPVNSGPAHFVVSAAYAALNRWVTTGVEPPKAPRLTVNAAGNGFQTDAYGNTLGGIRTPYVDVPTATLSAYGQPGSMETFSNNAESFCFLFGTTTLFDAARLKSLYPTHADYVAKVAASADAAVAQGFLLEPDAALIKRAAQASTVGN
jgi:hypothetical protein